MYDFLLKLRLLAEIFLTIISLYSAIEVDFGLKLINLLLFGLGIFAIICGANTIDAMQKWGRHSENQDDE